MTMCAVLDTYGFPLFGLTDDEQTKRKIHLERSSAQEVLWNLAKERGMYFIGRKLKERIRRGIPPKHRPDMWMKLSGAYELKNQACVNYTEHRIAKVKYSELDPDVVKAFRANLGIEGLQSVYRVLAAYATFSDEKIDGDMAMVVGFLMVVIGTNREEDVFWLLVALMKKLKTNTTQKVFLPIDVLMNDSHPVCFLVSPSREDF